MTATTKAAANSPEGRDIQSYMHPFTNARAHEQTGPLIIERGEGIYVYDQTGKSYIEGLAGLWSVAVGFNEDRLVNAAIKQLRQLPYYHTFASKSHTPGIELAEKLCNLTGQRLSKTFFTNSGSEANDTAIKMIWYYNNALGRPRKKKIISRLHSYHGSTIGSGSLTGIPRNSFDFDLPIQNILRTSCPHYYRFGEEGESEEEFSQRMADDLEKLILDEGPETIAAFFGEPVMAAGGVMPPPEGYWQKIQDICRKYDVLIVADEVICGFGRLGKMFGSDFYEIQPDMMILSKQLTSSYMPLAAVLITDQIYQTLADNSNTVGVFSHGLTGTGHPVATAVGLECINVIEQDGLVEKAARVGAYFQEALNQFKDHPLVGDVRGVGLIAGIELVGDKVAKTPCADPGKAGTLMVQHGHEHGLIMRNIGDTVALCPPLIITKDQVDELVKRFGKALGDSEKSLKQA